jgi:hypothetical protein
MSRDVPADWGLKLDVQCGENWFGLGPSRYVALMRCGAGRDGPGVWDLGSGSGVNNLGECDEG